ncbi:MAG: ABC transporter ATP-binding protein, partial [Deltaproteobacteria bacterium]
HLLSLVADRLWLVSHGRVTPYEDDLEAYRRMLLSPPPAQSQSPKPQVEKPKLSRDDRQALKADVRKCEERLEKLNAMRDKLAKRLADPLLYEDGRKGEAQVLQGKYGELMDGIDRAEALWVAAQEKFDAAMA